MHQARVPGPEAWTAGESGGFEDGKKNPRGWFFVSNVDIHVLFESEELTEFYTTINVSYI